MITITLYTHDEIFRHNISIIKDLFHNITPTTINEFL